ncbi:MAG: M56 family metallopeptidase [Gemmatimonadota bacterium]|nr:M56 family metallopeptidase [Gemmatimonadota bacterium]MDE2983271.1 M56 family metallopeptidase [Gemmatimonadota bacterium]
MIAAWMLWSIGAGLLFLVAGLAMERLLNRGRRWVWAAAGAGTVLLPAVRLLVGDGAAEGTASAGAVIALEPLAVTVAGDSVLHTLDDVLLMGWVAVSALLVVVALAGAARFAWRRRGWEQGTLLGRRVLWTRESGPAVVGLVTSRIVLPAWVAGAGRARQELVLAHEEEHLGAHDVQLRFLAALLLFAFPWNPALWVQYHRLGLAVELDCDRRVMDRWPERRRLYGDLLLRVGTGGRAIPAMAVAALAERKSLLEQRIRKLFSKAPEVRMAQAAFLAFGAILVVGVAVMVPGIAREGGDANVVPIPEAPAQAGEATLDEVVARMRAAEVEMKQELDRLEQRVDEFPLPPVTVEEDLSAAPMWTNVDVLPVLNNTEEVTRLLGSEYPPLLRDAGIGGTVVVWFFVDEAGEVVKTQVHTSSGHAALDDAALRVADRYEFSPATHEGEAVPVWVSLGIAFETR